MNRPRITPLLPTALFVVATLVGCADTKPKSITDELDQSAIDAYKETEKQIELEAMNDMDLGE